jgi:polyisoprenoid-binding protein YceI
MHRLTLTHYLPLRLFAVALLGFAIVPARAATYAIDPSHTFVTFEIMHFGTSTNRGRFSTKAGEMLFDRDAQTGQIDIAIETESVNTGTPSFDRILQSSAILNSVAFPTAQFSATDFNFVDGKVSRVNGHLTLVGITKPLTLTAINFNCYKSPLTRREVCGGDFEGSIDRTDFGIDYLVSWGFTKSVRLLVQIEVIRQ